ncbi:MAG: hypothetical protein IH624_01865 [Phycisphaerae bacterium]|nr:hypothetical protein [Phycisphaerae bacterium]
MDEPREVLSACDGIASREAGSRPADDADLLDYLAIVWRYRYMITAGSILLTLIVAAAVHFGSQQYSVTYVYRDWDFLEEDYEVFLNRFYSSTNLGRIETAIAKGGSSGSGLLSGWSTRKESAERIVRFSVWPEYSETRTTSMQDGSSPAVGELLRMTITCDSEEDLRFAGVVLRENIENLVPLLIVEKQLAGLIKSHTAKRASIEANRFPLSVLLTRNKAILERLRRIEPAGAADWDDRISLQFNIGSRSEYLPLAYHIRAVETQVLQAEEEMLSDEKTYRYYGDLTNVNEQLFNALKKPDSGLTIAGFLSYVDEARRRSDEQEIKDFLSSYLKTLSNSLLTCAPVSELPGIECSGRGLVRKMAVAFFMGFAFTTAAAFLAEGIRRRKHQIPAAQR